MVYHALHTFADLIQKSASHISWWRDLIFSRGKYWQHFLAQQSFADTKWIESLSNMQSRRRTVSPRGTRLELYLRRPLRGRIVANNANCICSCRRHNPTSSLHHGARDEEAVNARKISMSTGPRMEVKKSRWTRRHRRDQKGWHQHIHGARTFYNAIRHRVTKLVN